MPPFDIASLALQTLTLLVLALTLFYIVRYTKETSRSIIAQSYFHVIDSINTQLNDSQVRELNEEAGKHTSQDSPFPPESFWKDKRIEALANDVTNRYQVVAHLVERDFFQKVLFMENFSGTLLNVWNVCAPFISIKRPVDQNNVKLLYRRRDLERLGLHSWLYQYSIGFQTSVAVLDKFGKATRLPPDQSSVARVRERVKEIERLPINQVKRGLAKLTA